MASNEKNSGAGEKLRLRRQPRFEPAGLITVRRALCGWVDDEQGLAFTAVAMPRIRDSLVLRPVALRHGRGRSEPNAPGIA